MLDFYDTDDGDSDDEFGAELTEEAVVYCPYCGEGVEMRIDHGGGGVQEYVEDCGVCCMPWSVRVTVDMDGHPTVSVTTLDNE